MVNKAELDGLTIQEAKAAAYRAQGLSQAEAYRRAFDVKRAKPKTVVEKASRLFARNNVRARVQLLLREARVQDLDSVGQAFDDLLRLLEKAEADRNWTAAAAFMRQRLQVHGMLRDRLMVSAENLMTDEQLIERLAQGDPEKRDMLQSILPPPTFDEPTRH